MSDVDHLSDWINGYLRAWESNEPADITTLFTEDAAYYPAPYREPWRGHDQIVAGWLKHADEPGETSFVWGPISVTDELAVVRATTSYPDRVYSNLWLIRLAPDGRCREFTEWWMEQTPPSAE